MPALVRVGPNPLGGAECIDLLKASWTNWLLGGARSVHDTGRSTAEDLDHFPTVSCEELEPVNVGRSLVLQNFKAASLPYASLPFMRRR